MTTPEPGCGQCPHFVRHRLVALEKDNLSAGAVVLCPAKGCRCVTPWALVEGQEPAIPDLPVLVSYFNAVQGGR